MKAVVDQRGRAVQVRLLVQQQAHFLVPELVQGPAQGPVPGLWLVQPQAQVLAQEQVQGPAPGLELVLQMFVWQCLRLQMQRRVKQEARQHLFLLFLLVHLSLLSLLFLLFL